MLALYIHTYYMIFDASPPGTVASEGLQGSTTKNDTASGGRLEVFCISKYGYINTYIDIVYVYIHSRVN